MTDSVQQGEVYWIDLGEPAGSEPGYRRPHVVIQNNVFNASRIGTVVVCAITSNAQRARAPGNVLLQAGEANLSRVSVVNVSQLITVDRSLLEEKIGVLSERSVHQIVSGIKLLIEPKELW